MSASVQADVVDTTVETVVSGVKATGDVVKQGVSVAEQGVASAQEALSKVAPVVEGAAKTVAPVVNRVVEQGKPLVTSLAGRAGNASSYILPRAEAALKQAGVPQEALSAVEGKLEGGASQLARTIKPIIDSSIDFVKSSSPETLVQYAAGGAVAWLLLPPALSLVAASLRGYAGQASPPAILDALVTQSNVILIDIRSSLEKEAAGVPDVRQKNEYIELELVEITDGNVRRALKNVGNLEIAMTAAQIAALKKLSKNTKVYLMDKNDSSISRKGTLRLYANIACLLLV